MLIVVQAASVRPAQAPAPLYTKNTLGPVFLRHLLSPKCEVVHTPVHLSGLDRRGLGVEDGHSDPADGGMLDPVKSPLH